MRTDMTKLIVDFRNFTQALNNGPAFSIHRGLFNPTVLSYNYFCNFDILIYHCQWGRRQNRLTFQDFSGAFPCPGVTKHLCRVQIL